jgi:bis(5'-nucleosyl)-tetraphosphatase (symmetrical)
MYFIGDLQCCLEPLQRLLREIDFSPSRDTLYPLGDLVNRGPDSLGVLRLLSSLGDAARPILGNHDLHLLAAAAGSRRPNAKDTLAPILEAPDREALLNWVREQPLARQEQGWLLVHAGVLPSWTTEDTLRLAAEVHEVLRGPACPDFLAHMYGNLPQRWSDALQGWDRLRVIVNALTRLRLCTAEGDMEFTSTGPPSQAPAPYQPWFEVPGRRTEGQLIAFGHWSTLWLEAPEGRPELRHGTLGLDTGCLWGRCQTAARLGATPGSHELIRVRCASPLEGALPGAWDNRGL